MHHYVDNLFAQKFVFMTHYVLLNAQFFDQSMKQIDIWTVDRSISVD